MFILAVALFLLDGVDAAGSHRLACRSETFSNSRCRAELAQMDTTCDPNFGKHEVRCCSGLTPTDTSDWTKHAGCDNWAATALPECGDKTWEQAREMCKSIGGRLCTPEEVEEGCSSLVCSNGDNKVWTRESCTQGHIQADCYLSYCNAHTALKEEFCGGETCTTQEQYLNCLEHWTTTGKLASNVAFNPAGCAGGWKTSGDVKYTHRNLTVVQGSVETRFAGYEAPADYSVQVKQLQGSACGLLGVPGQGGMGFQDGVLSAGSRSARIDASTTEWRTLRVHAQREETKYYLDGELWHSETTPPAAEFEDQALWHSGQSPKNVGGANALGFYKSSFTAAAWVKREDHKEPRTGLCYPNMGNRLADENYGSIEECYAALCEDNSECKAVSWSSSTRCLAYKTACSHLTPTSDFVTMQKPPSGDRTIFGMTNVKGKRKTLHFVVRGGKYHMGFYSMDCQADAVNTLNEWEHVAFAYNKGSREMKIYVNGVLVKKCSNKAPFEGTQTVKLGTWANNRKWVGKIKGVQIWKQDLSAEHILSVAAGATNTPLLGRVTLGRTGCSSHAYRNFDAIPERYYGVFREYKERLTCPNGFESLTRAECQRLSTHRGVQMSLPQSSDTMSRRRCIVSSSGLSYAPWAETTQDVFCKPATTMDGLDRGVLTGEPKCSDGDATTVCEGASLVFGLESPMMLMRVQIGNYGGFMRETNVDVYAWDGKTWAVCQKMLLLSKRALWSTAYCQSTLYAERIKIVSSEGMATGVSVSEVLPEGLVVGGSYYLNPAGIGSGRCDQGPQNQIQSLSDCRTAVANLGFTVDDETSFNKKDRVCGCAYNEETGKLQWNSYVSDVGCYTNADQMADQDASSRTTGLVPVCRSTGSKVATGVTRRLGGATFKSYADVKECRAAAVLQTLGQNANAAEACETYGAACWGYVHEGNSYKLLSGAAADPYQCAGELGLQEQAGATTSVRQVEQIHDVALIRGPCWMYRMKDGHPWGVEACDQADRNVADSLIHNLEAHRECATRWGWDSLETPQCKLLVQTIHHIGERTWHIYERNQVRTGQCHEKDQRRIDFEAQMQAPRRRSGNCEHNAQRVKSKICKKLEDAMQIDEEIDAKRAEISDLEAKENTRLQQMEAKLRKLKLAAGITGVAGNAMMAGAAGAQQAGAKGASGSASTSLLRSGKTLPTPPRTHYGRERSAMLTGDLERRRSDGSLNSQLQPARRRIAVITTLMIGGALLSATSGAIQTASDYEGSASAEQKLVHEQKIRAIEEKIEELEGEQDGLRQMARIEEMCETPTRAELACKLEGLELGQQEILAALESGNAAILNRMSVNHVQVMKAIDRQNVVLERHSYALDNIENALERIINLMNTLIDFLPYQRFQEDITRIKSAMEQSEPETYLTALEASDNDWCNYFVDRMGFEALEGIRTWVLTEEFFDNERIKPQRKRRAGEEDLWTECEKEEYKLQFSVNYQTLQGIFEYAASRYLYSMNFHTATWDMLVVWRGEMAAKFLERLDSFDDERKFPSAGVTRCVGEGDYDGDEYKCPQGMHHSFPESIKGAPCQTNTCLCTVPGASPAVSTDCHEHLMTKGCTGPIPEGHHPEPSVGSLMDYVLDEPFCNGGNPATGSAAYGKHDQEWCAVNDCFEGHEYVHSTRKCPVRSCQCITGFPNGQAATWKDCPENRMKRTNGPALPKVQDFCTHCDGDWNEVKLPVSWFKLKNGDAMDYVDVFRQNGARYTKWEAEISFPRKGDLRQLELFFRADECDRRKSDCSNDDSITVTIKGIATPGSPNVGSERKIRFGNHSYVHGLSYFVALPGIKNKITIEARSSHGNMWNKPVLDMYYHTPGDEPLEWIDTDGNLSKICEVRSSADTIWADMSGDPRLGSGSGKRADWLRSRSSRGYGGNNGAPTRP